MHPCDEGRKGERERKNIEIIAMRLINKIHAKKNPKRFYQEVSNMHIIMNISREKEKFAEGGIG